MTGVGVGSFMAASSKNASMVAAPGRRAYRLAGLLSVGVRLTMPDRISHQISPESNRHLRHLLFFL